MVEMTGLSLGSEDPKPPARNGGRSLLLLVALLALAVAGLGLLAFQIVQRTRSLEQQLARLSSKADEASALARQALERAKAAEAGARAAAEGRQLAEVQTADARQQADTARQEADSARQEADSARREATGAAEAAARAKAEAERIRQKAEAEVNRLEAALGQIAETRRTALGLVMNLGSDYLKFEFDKAELRPEDRELLSRVAGILMTSRDYMISVNGHTDDVGSDEYNQKLSERRAQAVRDYLVKAGLPADIFSVEGHGKTLPLVRGSSEAARAKNRRVELGIVNIQIRYGL
jgi:outer membrane protein OmpA-like peptidoglycan-associated protein